ncbi:hypothetical protein LMG9964_02424 [Paraburkholderia phenoliruptrix]|uniref:Uncharacterized protein n=1 Tax=Paraburkholderia phenoliruptrix TaxID=252970 RepID=A0A6J5K2V7_9BURK|nr:hypothetical protein LMG9964_02424 [Paraburkholderia phenoliruptrix]
MKNSLPPSPNAVGNSSMALFIVIAANPTFTRSMRLTK